MTAGRMLILQYEKGEQVSGRCGIFFRAAQVWASSVQAEARRGQNWDAITADRSASAVMPEIDHRIGKGLECIVQPTETIKAKQEPPELVFPSEHPLDRVEPFVKYRQIKKGLRPRLGCFRPRGLGLMLGIMPRLKMALRFDRLS